MNKNLKTHVHTQKVNRSLFQLPSMTPQGSLLFFFCELGNLNIIETSYSIFGAKSYNECAKYRCRHN